MDSEVQKSPLENLLAITSKAFSLAEDLESSMDKMGIHCDKETLDELHSTINKLKNGSQL